MEAGGETLSTVGITARLLPGLKGEQMSKVFKADERYGLWTYMFTASKDS